MLLLLALTLASTLVQPTTRPTTAHVSGRVLEEGTRRPIAEVQVTLMNADWRPTPGSRPPRPDLALTDREGRFVFDGIEPGRYSLSIHKPGYAVLDEFRMHQVHLAPGERRTEINLTLQKGAVIIGRVVDEMGEPLVNAQVMAMRPPPIPPGVAKARSDLLVPSGPTAQTDDRGEFRLHSLPAGEYYIYTMQRADLRESSVRRATTILPTYFPGTSDRAAAQPVTVRAGETSADLTIRMVSAPAFEVSGIVRDASGRPVANAMVRLTVAEQSRQAPFMMMGPWDSARTDASGRFTINNVTDGAYTLLAIAPVVIEKSPTRIPGGIAGGVSSMSFSSGGSNGSEPGHVFTESADGITVQYRDDDGTMVPVTVNQADVSGLDIVLRPPSRR